MTSERSFVDSEEGVLEYLNESDLKTIETTSTTKCLIEDVKSFGDKVMIGVVDENSGKPVMNWSPVEDWQDKDCI